MHDSDAYGAAVMRLEGLYQEREKLRAALAEREAEIARLRETLKWIADECAPGGHSGESGGWWQRLNAVGDRARAALEQEPSLVELEPSHD